MLIAADTHVHIYPFYDLELSLLSAVTNLGNASTGTLGAKAIFLTERGDCDLFSELSKITTISPTPKISNTSEPVSLLLRLQDEQLIAIAGRQINTLERIEVLGLGIRENLSDQEPAAVSIDKILSLGGIPVIPWSPGKWWFKRGKLVRELGQRYSPKELLLGDTRLRPRLTPASSTMKKLEGDGFITIAGSDPLPLRGEERRLGQYGIILDGPCDLDFPFRDLKKLILNRKFIAQGRRDSFPSVLSSLVRLNIQT